MTRARKVIGAVSKAMELVAAFGIIVLMVLTVVHVLLRLQGGRGIAGGIEITEVVLAAVVFLGLAYAQRTDSHVSTSVLTDRLPIRISAVLRLVAYVIAVAFLSWMAYEAAKRGIESWQRNETRVGLRAIPIWPARVLLPVGLAMLVLEVLVSMIDALIELGTGRPVPPVVKSPTAQID